MFLALKLSLVPLVIWLASEAGRRWGHTVSGWITGLPLIAGPISIFLALDPGPSFAVKTGHAILQGTIACAAHCIVFAWAAQRFGWLASLLLSWLAFFAVAVLATEWTLSLGAAFALTGVGLAIAVLSMPRLPRATGPVKIPRGEVAIRMLIALAIAAAAAIGATTFGARTSAILLTFPISGSVLPAFTRALYGGQATVQLLRGFVLGLFGFAAFFFIVPMTLESLGIVPSYLLATVFAILVTLIITHLYTRLGLHREPPR
jgi:hypothetical protein